MPPAFDTLTVKYFIRWMRYREGREVGARGGGGGGGVDCTHVREIEKNISRVQDQNGISLLYIMLEIHHSGREPSKYRQNFRDRKQRGNRNEETYALTFSYRELRVPAHHKNRR